MISLSLTRRFLDSFTKMSWRGRRGYGHNYRGRNYDEETSGGRGHHGDRSEYGSAGGGGGGGRRREDHRHGRRGSYGERRGHGYSHGHAHAHAHGYGHGHGGGRGGGRRGGRHPGGLSGREIGLFYAERSKARRKKEEMANREEVEIDHRFVQYLEKLVNDTDSIPHGEHTVDVPRKSDVGKWWKAPITRNPEQDEQFKQELKSLESNSDFIELQQFRMTLPSWKQRREIVNVIESNRVTVISGETGCGKTTQVPQFILDHYITDGRGSACRVVCTQPRRISAITVAERVARERGSGYNNHCSTGYQIRMETRFPRDNGSILYCTTGIVLKWLESSPNLDHVSHLIIDEIHERDLLSDFLMVILKDVLEANPNIRVVLMSATLNAEKFSKYYNNAAMIHIPGFTFPVTEFYMEDVIEWVRYVPPRKKKSMPLWKQIREYKKNKKQILQEQHDFETFLRNIDSRYGQLTVSALRNMDFEEIDLDLVCQLIQKICIEKDDGAILVFLPGWEQISTVYKQLQGMTMFQSPQYILLPLHSMMPTVNQREVFEKPPPGVRKIILATNIAETSITIDDVVYVVDCGKIKIKNYDSDLNIVTLQPEWNSLANSRQRRGRAGRVQPGECYHLYTTYHESKLESYQKPEILRTRLEELCLQIKLLDLGDIRNIATRAMDSPDSQTVDKSIELLVQLNALDHEQRLTPLGHHLARLPVDPHAGKMILLGAIFSCLDPITTVAASLSFKDAFIIPLGKEALADERKRELSAGSKSDHIMLVKAYDGWERAKRHGVEEQYCWDNFLSISTLKMLKTMKSQFTDLLYDAGFILSWDPKHAESNLNSDNEKLVKAIVCGGLYPNVAKIYTKRTKRGTIHKLTTKDRRRANFHPKSVNVKEKDLESQWLVYYLMMKTKGINIFDATPVSPFSLLFFGGNIQFDHLDDEPCITVDDWIQFRSEYRVAELVKSLRQKLDSILSGKIRCPGAVDWKEDSYEGHVMRAIQVLITKDSNQVVGSSRHQFLQDQEDDDDDDDDDNDNGDGIE